MFVTVREVNRVDITLNSDHVVRVDRAFIAGAFTDKISTLTLDIRESKAEGVGDYVKIHVSGSVDDVVAMLNGQSPESKAPITNDPPPRREYNAGSHPKDN